MTNKTIISPPVLFPYIREKATLWPTYAKETTWKASIQLNESITVHKTGKTEEEALNALCNFILHDVYLTNLFPDEALLPKFMQEVYYQPNFDREGWEQIYLRLGYEKNIVFRKRENAKEIADKLFPNIEILEFRNDQIKDRVYYEDPTFPGYAIDPSLVK